MIAVVQQPQPLVKRLVYAYNGLMNEAMIALGKRLESQSLRSLAREMKLQPSYLSQIRLGQRPMSERVMRFLGFEQRIVRRK